MSTFGHVGCTAVTPTAIYCYLLPTAIYYLLLLLLLLPVLTAANLHTTHVCGLKNLPIMDARQDARQPGVLICMAQEIKTVAEVSLIIVKTCGGRFAAQLRAISEVVYDAYGDFLSVPYLCVMAALEVQEGCMVIYGDHCDVAFANLDLQEFARLGALR